MDRIVQIIDVGMGNVASVKNAFSHFDVGYRLVSTEKTFLHELPVILPGVGSFREGMERLRNANLIEPLRNHYSSDGYLLGICLGMQLLFDYGEEDGGTDGLGVIGGRVERFGAGLKLPHMGYNTILDPDSLTLTQGLHQPDFYFVHSYRVMEAEADQVAHTEHGVRFVSAVRRKNYFGTQFHPEKSQSCGLYSINKFIKEAFPD